jgi:signal transduction histidine kinase
MTWRQNALMLLEDGTDGASAALPAFIIDVAAGAIIAANGAGWKAWGLADAGADTAAVDRAMPVLRRLAAAARSRTCETLTFWTARGLLHLRCRVEPLADGDAFLVRAMPAGGGAAAQGRALPSHEHGLDDGRMSALARLAHEVRTPLSAAIAYAEVLKDEHFGPLGSARYRDYARTIYDSARHALSVVDGMLTGDAGGRGLPELAFRDLDPAGVIDNCVAVARPLAERAGLDLVASLEPGTPRVIADEVSLKQMLLNLMTNAIKFARPGDRITLGVTHGVDGCLRIEVADTGPGMTAVAAPPGEDAAAPDAHSAGLGIGLPLTRALAEANGAALLLDSAPGRGTRVTIAFGKDRVVPV